MKNETWKAEPEMQRGWNGPWGKHGRAEETKVWGRMHTSLALISCPGLCICCPIHSHTAAGIGKDALSLHRRRCWFPKANSGREVRATVQQHAVPKLLLLTRHFIIKTLTCNHSSTCTSIHYFPYPPSSQLLLKAPRQGRRLM